WLSRNPIIAAEFDYERGALTPAVGQRRGSALKSNSIHTCQCCALACICNSIMSRIKKGADPDIFFQIKGIAESNRRKQAGCSRVGPPFRHRSGRPQGSVDAEIQGGKTPLSLRG